MSAGAIAFAPVEDILAHLRAGGTIVLAGDSFRGGDVDLVVAAEFATAERVNFMATHGRGLVCLGITEERARQLGLSMINQTAERQTGRPFATSIEAREGVETGISAADRARTIAVATARDASPHDVVTPGHVFPLIARPGGALVRRGAVEAATDLMRLAGLNPAAVLCSVMADDGSMARIDDLGALVGTYGLKVASIEGLVDYRRVHDPLMRQVVDGPLESRFGGAWRQRVFRREADGRVLYALTVGERSGGHETAFAWHGFSVDVDLLGADPEGASSIGDVMGALAKAGNGILLLSGLEEANAAAAAEADVADMSIEVLTLIGAGALAPVNAISAAFAARLPEKFKSRR